MNSIIPHDTKNVIYESEVCWSDEEEDPRVDNMVMLRKNEFCFTKYMFTDRATIGDVCRMREEAKAIDWLGRR